MKKLFALLLAACMLMSVTAVFAEEAASADIPLVVATSTLSQKFSPYFADTGYDQDVVSMTQISMMTTDRVGGIIYNGIEGETIPYNGTDYTYYGTGDLTVNYDEATDITTYGYKMRNDLKFSDGEPVTIDDVIFTYYVYLDPAYNGSTTLSSYDILGLQAYRTQIPEANLESVTKIANDIKAAGFGYELKEGDSFTQEEYDAYYNAATELWKNDTQGIVDYVMAKYAADYAEAQIGYTVDEVNADEGLKVALGMVMWGFGKVEEADGKKVFTTSDGKAFNLTDGERPVIDDYFNATYAAYEGNIDNYLGTESAVGATTDEIFASTMTMVAKDQGVDMDAGVPNIAGIKRVDDYTVEVQVKGFSAPAVYSILGLNITPMHYYGDPAQYDYENNKFGHPYGDLSIAQSKTDAPMGGGPYKFVKYENRVAYYEANENYYLGAPKTKTFQYKETNSAEVASAIQTGTADGGEMTGNKANFEMLR